MNMYMEYYSALKKKELLQCATTWVKLEAIIISEMSQSHKDKCSVIPLM